MSGRSVCWYSFPGDTCAISRRGSARTCHANSPHCAGSYLTKRRTFPYSLICLTNIEIRENRQVSVLLMGKNQWRREVCRSKGGLEATMYGSLVCGSAERLEFPEPDGRRRLGRVRTNVRASCTRLFPFLRKKLAGAGESRLDPGSNSGTCPGMKRLKASTATLSGRLRDIPVTGSRTHSGWSETVHARVHGGNDPKTVQSIRIRSGRACHVGRRFRRDLPCPSVGWRNRAHVRQCGCLANPTDRRHGCPVSAPPEWNVIPDEGSSPGTMT